jgi:hypothetical protein
VPYADWIGVKELVVLLSIGAPCLLSVCMFGAVLSVLTYGFRIDRAVSQSLLRLYVLTTVRFLSDLGVAPLSDMFAAGWVQANVKMRRSKRRR